MRVDIRSENDFRAGANRVDTCQFIGLNILEYKCLTDLGISMKIPRPVSSSHGPALDKDSLEVSDKTCMWLFTDLGALGEDASCKEESLY